MALSLDAQYVGYLMRSRLQGTKSEFDFRNEMQGKFNEFASTHCTKPTEICISNHYTGEIEKHYYPCGQCDHCRNTRANQLSFRIEQDARIQGHCYFITLTYTSVYSAEDGTYYGLVNRSVERYCPNWQKYTLSSRVLDLLSSNLLHYDCDNTFKHWCYTTCLLNMDDFAGFMKRLRKSMPGTFFQFVCFGEYGHKFGHPHMHAIVSSDKPVSVDEFNDAWSIYGCPIGNCYVQDLVKNGTITGVRDYNTTKCVKYVSKYMSKGNSEMNSCRLRYAWKYFVESAPDFVSDDHFEYVYNTDIINNPLKKEVYEKADFASFGTFCSASSRRPRYSNRNCFGSLYLSANIDRFASGNTRISAESSSTESFPYYFLRKVRQKKYPIGFCKESISGSRYYIAPPVPYIMGCVPLSYGYNVPDISRSGDFSFDKSNTPFPFNNGYTWFYRYDTGERLMYMFGEFYGFKYSRKDKQYICTGTIYETVSLLEEYARQESLRYAEERLIRYQKEWSDCMYNHATKYDPKISSFDLREFWTAAVEREGLLWQSIRSRVNTRLESDKYNTL